MADAAARDELMEAEYRAEQRMVSEKLLIAPAPASRAWRLKRALVCAAQREAMDALGKAEVKTRYSLQTVAANTDGRSAGSAAPGLLRPGRDGDSLRVRASPAPRKCGQRSITRPHFVRRLRARSCRWMLGASAATRGLPSYGAIPAGRSGRGHCQGEYRARRRHTLPRAMQTQRA